MPTKPKVACPVCRRVGCVDPTHHRAQRRAQVTLVCGPPGAGKTTWVQQRMQPGDLVVDLDALCEALSGLPRYIKPAQILPFAYEARDAVLDRLTWPSDVRAAWVIAGAPERTERQRLAAKLQAEVVVLATDAEECLQRIAAQARADQDMAAWRARVQDWWRRYEPRAGDVVAS